MMLCWDLDGDGLLTAVQFGAPPRQERLLLGLAGDLETVPALGRPSAAL